MMGVDNVRDSKSYVKDDSGKIIAEKYGDFDSLNNISEISMLKRDVKKDYKNIKGEIK